MATGIISTGTFLLGPSWLSQALLVIASIGFVVLIAALVIQLARYRPQVVADFQAPERVFGFFAISASCDLLGARYVSAGHPMVATGLACLAAAVWLALTYGVPASLLLARRHDSVLSGVDGSWLLWVVGTQSLSIDASTLTGLLPVGLDRARVCRPLLAATRHGAHDDFVPEPEDDGGSRRRHRRPHDLERSGPPAPHRALDLCYQS